MQRAGEEMEWEQVIRQRQVGGVTLTVWGHARPPRPGMLLFFPNEYLYQAHDNTITQVQTESERQRERDERTSDRERARRWARKGRRGRDGDEDG